MKAHRLRVDPELATAEALIRARAERLTGPRSAVLAALLTADGPLTHHEVEAALRPRAPVDRVTVYRVLEWLVDRDLAHRIAGDDRTWRFRANAAPGSAPHAHFTCTGCGRTVCLDSVTLPRRVRVPEGFRPDALELTVRGRCARCH